VGSRHFYLPHKIAGNIPEIPGTCAFRLASYHGKGVMGMKMVRLLIQVPAPIKAKLDTLRTQGTTASGLIRHLLEAHFTPMAAAKKGR
jgi:hypothetical protein